MKRTEKKVRKFTRRMQKKLAVLFAIIMLALIGLNVRLTYINAESGEKYTKQILTQQQYDSKVIPFKRGDIVDRKGTVIATSEKVYNVIMDCKIINSKEDYINPTVSALSTCFNIEESEIRTALSEKSESRYYIIRKQLTYDEIQEFVEMQMDSTTYPNIKGVWFEEEYIRKYPYSTLASDLIGFATRDNVSYWGIEAFYNEELNGTNGREYGYLNDDSNLERTVKNATDGNTLISSIDVNVQSIVEKHIALFNESNNYDGSGVGSKNTAVIIMNPNTGEILAEASAPSFDLNNPYDLTNLYTEEQIADMDDVAIQEALNNLWRNFCISDTYEPGSTAKPFTVAAGLESGKLTGNETYICDGKEEVGGYTIRCVNRTGHGLQTIEEAVMNSCNDALMQMSYSIGIAEFTKYQSIFNLGKKTNVDLPGEVNGASLIYTLDDMTPIDLATNSFGQNFNVTMTQMITGFSSLINGGYYYQPHVVNKIVNSNGGTVETIKPTLVKQTVSSETSAKIKQYLYKTVQDGTGRSAKVNGYSMGGKTGTAEKSPRKHGNYLVSFIGFTPADYPEVVIYVVIDEPNVEKQADSSLATTLAKDILTEVLPYLNIFPDEEVEQEAGQEETTEGEIRETGQEGESETPEQTQEETAQEDTTPDNIDPLTGEELDPLTGEPLDPNASVFE